MQPVFETTCLVLFLILMVMPGLYGLHLYLLMFLAHRRMKRTRAEQRSIQETFRKETSENDWPRVTTQIPLYNELAVARRVIEAVARMDYPSGRHEIQVLDDSSDGTRALVDRVCAELRGKGVDAKVVRRPTREHYKAGALAHGLREASGELLAVFDADFLPQRDFLRNMVPLLATDDDVCCAQARWGHLNADESWLTEALSLGIDGHFGVEQSARGWNGFLLNFNGTAGIWRKSAILDERVGGWSGDTVTEDLDLSYRAQLAGWRIVYCLDEVCPAEIPADADAIKAQQRRWAKGSIQTARKLLPAVWRSGISLTRKLEATIHLTQYSISVFMILMALCGRTLLALVPPDRYQGYLMWSWWLIVLAAVAPSVVYIYARRAVGGGPTGLWRIVKLIALGLGLSVNNSVAVLEGLVRSGGEFVRTPKSGSDGTRRGARRYAVARSRLWVFELLLGVFCFAQWLVFLREDHYVGGLILLLFAGGLLSLGWASRPRASHRPAATLNAASAPHDRPDATAEPAMRPNL